MKIYINARFLTQQITGVQRYAIEISTQLNTVHTDITFVTPKKIIHKDLAKKLNISINGRLSGHLWEQIELPKYLKKHNNPLLINLANTAPLFYKNQIVTIHDLAFLRNPKWFSSKFYLYYKLLIPKIAENSLKIITVSNFSRKEIVNLLNIPEEKVGVIYNAVSQDFIELSRDNFENKYGEYILSVASLDPRKNFKNLVLSFNKLNLKGTKLVIVGSENKVFADQKLKSLIQENPNIILTGYVTDEELIGLYRNATFFIFPSLYEGFGLPPLEAMACGCPVVVSNAASLPEVCGDAAYYVNPYNVESIAEGMYKVLTDETLRQSLIQKGIERAKLFSWEKSAKEHIRVFEEVLNLL